MVIVERWEYSENHFEQFIRNFAIKSGSDAKYLQKVLSEGGGKAFGLIVADEICKRLNALGDPDFKVPSWRLYSNESDLPAGWCERKSSAKADWLDSRAGVKGDERGFIQEFAKGDFWLTVDYAYSPIIRENVIKISSGYFSADSSTNSRFSTCVSNPAVGLFLAGSGKVIATHEFVRDSFFHGSTISKARREELINALTMQLPTVIRELGINFGIQLEFAISGSEQYLLQVRPTPAIIYNEQKTDKQILPELYSELPERILTPLVSGAFYYEKLSVVVYSSSRSLSSCSENTCLIIPSTVSIPEIFSIYQRLIQKQCACTISSYILGANTKHYSAQEPECSDPNYPLLLNTQMHFASVGLSNIRIAEVEKWKTVKVVSDGMICGIQEVEIN